MRLIDAVEYLRNNVLDDMGGTSAVWDVYDDNDYSSFQLRWGNEELVSNINEALNQVYRRILPVKEVNSKFDIKTKDGQQSYELDPRILQVEGVRSKSTNEPLDIIDIDDVWHNAKNYNQQGKPTRVLLDYNTQTINFFRIPDANNLDTYSLLVYRLPLYPLCWENNEEEIELREEFIIPMLDYAAHLCYNKDEANTLDPNRSLMFLQRFNQEFPFTSAYSDVRKRRTTNKSVRYGGL